MKVGMFLKYDNVLGGETIREINRLSGAHVELSRHPPPGTNPRDRVFKVQGNPDQIQHAMRLIAEKAGLVSEVRCKLHFSALFF